MRSTLPFAIGLLMAALDGTLAAQAIVENAVGRAVVSTAPTASAGKSIGGIASSLDRTLKGKPAEGGTTRETVRSTSRSGRSSRTAAPPPARNYEDPMLIEKGLAYDELIRRFGPPALQMTSGPGSNSLAYSAKDGTVQVEVQDGKVASIDKPKS